MADDAAAPNLHIPPWQLDVKPASELEAEPARPSKSPSLSAGKVRSEGHTPPPPLRVLEALLFVSAGPLTAERAAEVVRGLTPGQFQEHLEELGRTYRAQARPYLLQKREQGYVLGLRPTYRFVLEKLYGGVREARLSLPAVEVLAIVAYRQPIPRREVETLRGHDSAALLRQLVRRGLIGIIGRAESGGNDVQYGTTPRFLEIFGLSSLEDLPETEDLSRL